MDELTRTTLAIERDLLRAFDTWTVSHGYTNRSEAVRDLIRSILIKAEWENPEKKVVGVLSVTYDHDAHSLAQELTSIQHEDPDAILCSQHVHLGHHKCLEVILMQGLAGQLRRIADRIIATRGVGCGKLMLMSGGL